MKRKLNDIVKNKDLKKELKELHAIAIEPISKDDFEKLLKKVVDGNQKECFESMEDEE